MFTVFRWIGYGLSSIGVLAIMLCWTMPGAVPDRGHAEDESTTTVRMASRLFVADDLAGRDGYTYTLPSRLGSMLAELEGAYGRRDESYTILGIEFGADEAPQVWYPGNRRHVIIQLARNALLDDEVALFQLAHEAVHLLSPSGGPSATVLEEGLAAMYATDYTRRLFPNRRFGRMASYVHAEKLVRQLVREDAGCVGRLRRIQPSFSTWKATDLIRACPTVSPELPNSLLVPFVR